MKKNMFTLAAGLSSALVAAAVMTTPALAEPRCVVIDSECWLVDSGPAAAAPAASAAAQSAPSGFAVATTHSAPAPSQSAASSQRSFADPAFAPAQQPAAACLVIDDICFAVD